MEICNYDPAHEWDKHCEQQERQLAKRQRCSECDEPIMTTYCHCINGEYICDDCMEQYRVETPVED